MVNFTRLNQLIRSAARLSYLIKSKDAQRDADALEICSSVGEELAGMQEELKPMIARLDSHEEQMILTLRFIRGYEYPWIATSLNISERTVFNRLKSAKQRLKTLFPGQVEA